MDNSEQKDSLWKIFYRTASNAWTGLVQICTALFVVIILISLALRINEIKHLFSWYCGILGYNSCSAMSTFEAVFISIGTLSALVITILIVLLAFIDN